MVGSNDYLLNKGPYDETTDETEQGLAPDTTVKLHHNGTFPKIVKANVETQASIAREFSSVLNKKTKL